MITKRWITAASKQACINFSLHAKAQVMGRDFAIVECVQLASTTTASTTFTVSALRTMESQ